MDAELPDLWPAETLLLSPNACGLVLHWHNGIYYLAARGVFAPSRSLPHMPSFLEQVIVSSGQEDPSSSNILSCTAEVWPSLRDQANRITQGFPAGQSYDNMLIKAVDVFVKNPPFEAMTFPLVMAPGSTGTFFEQTGKTFAQYRAQNAARAQKDPLWRAWAELIAKGLPLYVAQHGSSDPRVKHCIEG